MTRRVARVAVLPHAVAEDDDGCRARGVLARGEVPAEERLLPQQPERVGRDRGAADPFGRVVRVADGELLLPEPRQARERPRLGAPVLELLPRGRRAVVGISRGVAGCEKDDLLRPVERQATDEHRVHEGEDRRVDPDAQSQRHGGDGGEPGVLEQHADGVAEVLEESHRDRTAIRAQGRRGSGVRGSGSRLWAQARASITLSKLLPGA